MVYILYQILKMIIIGFVLGLSLQYFVPYFCAFRDVALDGAHWVLLMGVYHRLSYNLLT